MLPDLIIGGISGVVSRTMTAPLELYKLQRQNTFMPGSTIRNVIREEGIFNLWKGNGTNCIRIFPQTAINYHVYAFCDESLQQNISDGNIRRFVAGTIGGAVSMVLTYPLETIRSRLSLQRLSSHYVGIIDALYLIPKRDLFQGLRMSILGYAPFTAISFSTYFTYKDWFCQKTTCNEDVVKVLSGGLSGLTAISITYPSDLIRRRLQLQNFDRNVPAYSGIVDCVQKIIAAEGVRGLYRGLFATGVKLFPTIGIQFLVMDTLKEIN